MLIHEAAGEAVGHSSAKQAGEIAARAGVEVLYLVHYPTQGGNSESLVAKAEEAFNGRVVVAQDFDRLTFN